eukprot:5207842-Pleurochrysis_carterae.AAC.1
MSLHTKELCPLSRPQPCAHSANKSCQPVRDLRATKSSNNFERHVSLPGMAPFVSGLMGGPGAVRSGKGALCLRCYKSSTSPPMSA